MYTRCSRVWAGATFLVVYLEAMAVGGFVVLGAEAEVDVDVGVDVDVVDKWPATMLALEVILSLAVGRRGFGAASVGVDSVTKSLQRQRKAV
jgi:hypothetical protein